MEIYRNEPQEITLRAPVDGEYKVTIKSPDHESEVVPTVAEKKMTFFLDFRHTWYDGKVEFEIEVTTGGVTHTYVEYAQVVTPLFHASDVPDDYPEKDVPELERLVRHVIEARTGQSFGRQRKRIISEGHSKVISFDVPLIEFTGVSTRYLTGTTTLTPPKESYEIAADRFSVAINWDYYDIKTDSMWILNQKHCGYHVIEGVFGYNGVPADVKEAALLIAGVWGCDQAVWRDRYLNVMRSSDWSVGYHPDAFKSTGSVTADQLLAKYTRKYLPEVF